MAGMRFLGHVLRELNKINVILFYLFKTISDYENCVNFTGKLINNFGRYNFYKLLLLRTDSVTVVLF